MCAVPVVIMITRDIYRMLLYSLYAAAITYWIVIAIDMFHLLVWCRVAEVEGVSDQLRWGVVWVGSERD